MVDETKHCGYENTKDKGEHIEHNENIESIEAEKQSNRSALTESFINTEIFIDFNSEILYGEDQANVCYPVRFPTVRFQLMPANRLIEIVDRLRHKLGFKPMYPINPVYPAVECNGNHNHSHDHNHNHNHNCCDNDSSDCPDSSDSGDSSDSSQCKECDNDGWYDFFISLNGFNDTHLDNCIEVVVAGSDSIDNEEVYTIDLSEAEQKLLYSRFDEQCRKCVGKGCEELLKEAKEIME